MPTEKLNQKVDLNMRRFLTSMLTTVPILIAGDAIAQQSMIISDGPKPTLEVMPAEFGDVGTQVKIKVENSHQPLQNGLATYGLSDIGTDDKRSSISLCGQPPLVDLVCECVYTVTQADTNRGFIKFGATETGEDMFEDFTGLEMIQYVTEFKKTDVETINYNPTQNGWTGTGLNDCSMEGWSWPTGNGGFVETDPLLPTLVQVIPPDFLFDITSVEVPSGEFWIDPPVAAGYTYEISGAEFISVKMPSSQTVADPDFYTLTYGTHTESLQPGDSHFFQNPVSTFEITDINPPTPLDPNDVTAFPIGIDLTDPVSDVQIRQTPISEGPSVAPSVSKSRIYPPASVNLTTNAVDPAGGALQFNWTGTNLSNASAENPMATFTSTVATPTSQAYAVTATNSSGVSSSTETVDLTLLPKQCVGLDGANILNLLPVYTTSLNGNYTVKAKIPDLASHFNGRLSSLKSVNQDFQSISYSFSITNQSNLPVSGIDKVSGKYDGSDLSLFAPGTPITEFWNGSALVVGQWYSLNIGMDTDPIDATDLSCRTNNVKFRLPQAPYPPGRRRVLTQRPMEIQTGSGGPITTVMVPIHAKAATAVLTNGLGIKTPVGVGDVAVGDIVANGGGRLSDVTDNSGEGVKVIKRRGPIGIKRDEDLKKDVKKKRLPRGR